MQEIPRYIDNQLLRVIRDNADWQAVFRVLGLSRDEQKSKVNDWWAVSPLSKEKTASFHLNAKGWFCFSTNQGGGVVELVQKVLEQRQGRAVTCYEAGRWMLEQGVSSLDQSGPVAVKNESARSEEKERDAPERAKIEHNEPISVDLRPRLVPHHPELEKRGISTTTCRYLGCGYLSNAKGTINNRIVFQVRGVEERGGQLAPVILSHIGRAVSDVQADVEGKWHHYAHFKKHLELFNLDKLLLDERARQQAQQTGRVIVVEGCFDAAKLIEAGIYNVVATFGARCSEEQARRLKFIADRLGVGGVLVWYDKDYAGRAGKNAALPLLEQQGLAATAFPWHARAGTHGIKFSTTAKDACDLSVVELQQLRAKGVI